MYFVQLFSWLLGLNPNKKWGEKRGSNPRQPESQSGALPTELFPP